MKASILENSSQRVSSIMLPGHSLADIHQPDVRHQLPIRRHKTDDAWMVADGIRNNFINRFDVGLLGDVTFIHKAKPMTCISGYESTGEAVGNLTVLKKSWWRNPSMPPGVIGQEIVYNPKSRFFHMLDDESPVDSADYLLLFKDGRAIVGWID